MFDVFAVDFFCYCFCRLYCGRFCIEGSAVSVNIVFIAYDDFVKSLFSYYFLPVMAAVALRKEV